MEVIIEFGSQISGGVTKYSDKDLLVVCSPDKKNAYQRKYAQQGYSVSFYTPSQLEHMRLKGALFLQHLKFESNILLDIGGYFQKFINSCDFIRPSPLELERCRTSISEAILSPSNKILNGWLSDYLYVLSRDYFVKYFATKGQLIFNANKLCTAIKDEFDLSNDVASAFLELRKNKSIYRNSIPQLNQSNSSLVLWIGVLNYSLGLTSKKPYLDHNYLNKGSCSEFNSTYELLRYVESLLILFPDVSCGSDKDLLIKKLITNPNNYCSTSNSGKTILDNYRLDFMVEANKALQSDKISASLQFYR
jgi:hypothetical protein